MKRIILYTIIIFTFCNCQNKKDKTSVAVEQIKDINKIVEAIIIQDSLDVFSKSEDSTMFCSELRKLKISIPPKNSKDFIALPLSDGIYITLLIPSKIKGHTFFSSKDSLYLLEQNSNPEKLKIGKYIVEKLNTTTIEKTKIPRKKGKRLRFYEMTIPILSADKQNAYVELDYQSGYLYGTGRAIFLKKINGKWKIIVQYRNWIS